ncbi:MAG: SDR family oxidoreductase [candidate division WOR-3 bacterium]|nr:SDR family oxidoreductase [candidate division WOR-3 bacterium]
MSGRNILLVGASGGIGTGLRPLFVDDRLILHYHRNKPEAPGYTVSADITRSDEVQTMVSGILNEFGRIDAAILAAGVSIDGFAHKIPADAWRSVIETNLIGVFNVIQAVLPSMRANSFGRIILLSSVAYQRPVVGTSAYSASKAALVGLTRTVALENAGKGVTCNCIALGYFDAGMLYSIPAEVRENIKQTIPLGRFGRIEEIHRTIQFLIDTEYVTGQIISLNGGLSFT